MRGKRNRKEMNRGKERVNKSNREMKKDKEIKTKSQKKNIRKE